MALQARVSSDPSRTGDRSLGAWHLASARPDPGPSSFTFHLFILLFALPALFDVCLAPPATNHPVSPPAHVLGPPTDPRLPPNGESTDGKGALYFQLSISCDTGSIDDQVVPQLPARGFLRFLACILARALFFFLLLGI